MNWEHTHLAMAPKAGRAEELRNEATAYRQSRELTKKRISQRARVPRFGFATGLAAKGA
jgi:hypothetical protein